MMTGNILWFLVIGVVVYYIMGNGGGCCSHRHIGSGSRDPNAGAGHTSRPKQERDG